MNRKKRGPGFVHQHGFRSIPVVHIEIVHGDSFSSRRQRLQHCNRNIAQVAKSHSAIACGMVSGRSYTAEHVFTCSRRLECFKSWAERSRCMSSDDGKI